LIKFLTWRNLSIKEKLILISFVTTGSALFLVGTIFITGEILSVRQSSLTYLSGITKTISQNSVSYITNKDKKGVEKAFETLNTKLDITCAVLYDHSGNILTQFGRGTQCRDIQHPLPKGESHHFGLTHMDITQEIKRGQDNLGTIHVRAHLEGYYSKVMSYATTLIVIMGCSFLFGYILFSNLQNTVTRHISELASLMKIVSMEKNYSVRINTVTKDEIGVLSEGFNEMLHTIETRDIELARYREGLEDLVDQRTKELIDANEQLQKELTERIKIEKALQESEYRYRTIFETTGNANAIVEKDLTISMVNSAFEKLSGLNRYEIENKKTLLEFAEINDLERIKSYLLARKEHSDSVPGEFECRLITSQGSPRDVYASVSFIPGTTKSIASFIDVTDLRKLQGQLLHSQKMEAVGQLAGGIAHDFNNILTIIMGYGNILMMNTDKDSTIRPYVESILTSAERATNLTQSLLAFSRKQSISPKNIELNGVIINVAKLLRRLIGEDIELQTQLSKTVMPVFADPGQIEQVLINLAANARDAMPQGGSLIIKTEILNNDQEFFKTFPNYKPGKYALISVADTGTGMNQEIAERIFEPFFTTKEEGKGTGLGLSIVHGVITQHSGHIEVHSEPGQGTVFQMYLPIVAYQKEETHTPIVPHSTGGSETVLVAEDNEPVRILIKNILAEYGYSVIESANGEDAVEKFRNCNHPVHLLLLDVILPRIDGKSVYEEIRKIKPDIKALFMSGYTTDIIQQHGISGNEYNFVQKPVLPHILLSKVRNVLNAN
jgi:PAS domain S-box-containing protein